MSIGFDVKALDRKKCGSAPTTSTTGPATSLDHETSESESSTNRISTFQKDWVKLEKHTN